MPLRRWPVVPLAVAFGGGIATAPVVTFAAAWAVWAVAVAVAGTLLGLARPGPATGAVLLAVGAVGVLRGLVPPAPADHVSRLDLPRTARIDATLAG